MTKSPVARVTVCIPTFNRAYYLRQAIESILDQSFQDFSILVSDNASTDDTPDVVASFDDPRISYVRLEQNIGWCDNFNLCYERLEGEYGLLLSDDDELLPDFLATTVAVLDRHAHVGMVHTGFDLVDADGNLLGPAANWTDGLVSDTIERGDDFIHESMRWSCRVCSSTVLARTEALPSVCYDPRDVPAADFGLWLRIALEWDIAFIAGAHARYRIHAESESASWGTAEGAGYQRGFDILERTRDVKLRLLESDGHRWADPGRLRADADWALHREIVNSIRSATLPDRRLAPTLKMLRASVERHPRLALKPAAWRLVGASLLGPRAVARMGGR